ncbi:MAG: tRNA (N(6)-L-threonylcarbamoyladenosine(37)-C(2))-methylthiotransferase MtaB [Planctomycetota bacterium]
MLNFISIGCKVNQAEMSEIKDKMHDSNIKIGIINTCAVTAVSEAKSRKLIRRFIRENPDYRLIVTGCFAEAQPDIVRRLIRQNDIVVSNRDKSSIPELVKQLTPNGVSKETNEIISHIENEASNELRSSISLQPNNRTRAFLKIQDGCRKFCSYCIVPFLRSEMWSKSEEIVEDEVRNIIDNGYKEIVLSGVNLGLYGNLVGLLERLIRLTGLERIRISSIELNDVSNKLVNLIAKNPKICPHFHIPLQSGSDKIIKLMKRNYTSADYINRINFIKSKIENPAITTDVIVGFPGESDDDFKETLLVCQKVGFSKIHIFSFSPRKGTVASEMKNKVKPEMIKKRFIMLNNLEREIALKYKQLFLGKEVDVLVEDSFEGFTERYIRVKIEHDKEDGFISRRNQIIRVKINEIKDKWMKGMPVELSFTRR